MGEYLASGVEPAQALRKRHVEISFGVASKCPYSFSSAAVGVSALVETDASGSGINTHESAIRSDPHDAGCIFLNRGRYILQLVRLVDADVELSKRPAFGIEAIKNAPVRCHP